MRVPNGSGVGGTDKQQRWAAGFPCGRRRYRRRFGPAGVTNYDRRRKRPASSDQLIHCRQARRCVGPTSPPRASRSVSRERAATEMGAPGRRRKGLWLFRDAGDLPPLFDKLVAPESGPQLRCKAGPRNPGSGSVDGVRESGGPDRRWSWPARPWVKDDASWLFVPGRERGVTARMGLAADDAEK